MIQLAYLYDNQGFLIRVNKMLLTKDRRLVDFEYKLWLTIVWILVLMNLFNVFLFPDLHIGRYDLCHWDTFVLWLYIFKQHASRWPEMNQIYQANQDWWFYD
jgi:hypothetical protein